MKPKDPDTFIDIGVSITRLLLIASGQGMAASLIGEGAGLLKDLGNLGSGGRRAVSAEKIADEVADQLFREHQGISEADWQVAATNVAPLIDRLSEKDRLAAGYDWTALCPVLLELGGAERRRKLADESARRAFDRVLDVACQRIADLFTEKEALASLLEKVDGVQSGVQQLLNRPAGASKTRDIVIEHIKALRDLAPDRLEDRESEMTDLEAFVRSSDDVWYAMEADMVSGKTAVMASFALNPPDDVHMVSFFIRRIGGDGSDRGSFAFVMGAQLAKILGHEYTEPVRDPAQHTEFRQMLRRAATACRSEATPRTLVLLIDGIDEDSYFENPDGADAKSILSLLPRRLPEGVKIITASRPNPRLPEDVLCDADRRIVSLKPSPIAEKSINRKDMKIFFKSDVAVDIGAFLAACGGVLTVEDLRRLLTMRGYQRTRTWDVREYVDRSPGRILTPVDVGFGGQKVLAYRLGHDVVTRAVIRELDSDSFGEGDEPEDERWWAPIREKALAPYGAIIRDWVKEYASRGWGGSTPSYVLSGACFDLMLNDKKDGGSSVRVVLDRGRYDEMRRRSGRRSYVLRMIDRECFTILDMNRGELPEDATTSIFEVAESRSLFVRMSAYVPGLPGLHVSHFNATPDVVLDMILSIDEPKSRLDALRETTEAAINSGRGYAFLPILPVVLESLGFYRDLRDRVLRLLVDVFVHIDSAVNELKTGDNGNVNLRDWFSEVLVCINAEDGLSRLLPSFENVDGLGKGAHSVSLFLLIAEGAAERIKGSWARAWALVRVVGVLARAGEINRARRVAESAVSAADQIKDFRERTWALVGVAGVLARAGEINRARRVAESAVSAADQIKDPQGRAQALVEMVGVLAQMGEINEARRIVENAVSATERVNDPQGRARALVRMVGVLAQMGEVNEARRIVENAVSATERVNDPQGRARALVKVADALVKMGEVNEMRRVAESAMGAADQIKDPQGRAWALVKVADALARAGEINRARRVAESAVSAADQIKDPQGRAQALVKVADALVRAGQIDEALDVAERVKDPQGRARALVKVADALVRAGQINRARRVAENAVSAVDQTKDFRERARALVGVADALTKMGEVNMVRRVAESAMGAADQIKDFRERARALVGVADALTKMGEVNMVRRVAESAMGAADQIKDFRERARALVGVADALTKMGEVNMVRRVAESAMGAADQIKDFRGRARALVGVAGALTKMGEVNMVRRVAESAMGAADQIKDFRGRAWALVGVADVLAKMGEVNMVRRVAESAMGAADQIKDFRGRARALVGVAGALTKMGEVNMVRRVAESAMGAADQIKDFRGRAWALVGVAGALAKMGEVNMVRRVAESAVSAADQIKDPQGRAWALVGAADVLARAGQINEALDMAERVKDPQGRMRVLMGVVSVLAQTGETNRIQRVAEDAVNTAVRVEESKERAQALAGVVKALARAGAIDEVREIVTMINEPSSRSRAQSVVIKALVGKGSSDEAVNMLRVALAEVEGLVRRQDAADYCATLAAACLDAADLVDAESTTHEQWLGLSRSTLARSWLYGASVWDRFDVLLRVVPDLATRLVEERLLVEPESAGPASSVDPTDRADPEPRPSSGPDPEGPGGGAPSSR